MRILHLHHFPLQESAIGHLVAQWAAALVAAGHDARILVVDRCARDDEPLIADRMVCQSANPAADLAFDLPRFGTSADAHDSATFLNLSVRQLAQYRERLRRRLDVQIDRFNPDVIHAQHVWLLAQLAMETGVPYIVNAWGPELADCRLDARYRALADQAAVNAGRILAPDAATLREVADLFELPSAQLSLLPEALKSAESSVSHEWQHNAARELTRFYQAVLDDRLSSTA